jgi:hypothetical protein
MSNTKPVFVIALYLLLPIFCHSQTTVSSISLKDYFKIIEAESLYTFNYAEETIKDIYITTIEPASEIEEIIDHLKRSTTLNYEWLGSNTILISPLNIKTQQTEQLEEVLIKNYLTKGIFINADGSTKITPSDFGIMAGLEGTDVLQVVQKLPGVNSVNEKFADLNIRGGSSDENTIFWNGINMYQSSHLFGLISAFNSKTVQEVKVMKNGSSAAYGSGVSGVIDMKTKFDDIQQAKYHFGINLISADICTLLPISKRHHIQVSARRSMTDFLKTETYNNYFKRISQNSDLLGINDENLYKNEVFFFNDFTFNYLFKISTKSELQFNAIAIQNSLTFDENDLEEESVIDLKSLLKQVTFGLSVNYHNLLSENLKLSSNVYYSKFSMDAVNNDVYNNQILKQGTTIIENGLKINLNKKINNYFQSEIGYQFIETGVGNLEKVNRPLFRRYEKLVLRTNALYNQWSFKSKNNNTKLNFGWRLSYIDRFSKFILEPRFSFQQKLANQLRLEILGETKNQYTSQGVYFQNDFLGIEKRRWRLSNNSDIPILQSRQISLGLHHNKNSWLSSVEGFYKSVEGLTTRSQGFLNQYQFTDAIGQYYIYGVDFLLQKEWNKFKTWLTYSWSVNDYEFESLNKGLLFSNNFDINNAMSWNMNYESNLFDFALSLNWRNGKPYTGIQTDFTDSSGNIQYETPNSLNLPNYTRVDVSINHDFKIYNFGQSRLSLSVFNLFNNTNSINRFYLRDQNNAIEKGETIGLGLTSNLSFQLSF